MAKENHELVLEMKNISKAFPGVQALDKVDLKVRKDTVHALIGENGPSWPEVMHLRKRSLQHHQCCPGE